MRRRRKVPRTPDAVDVALDGASDDVASKLLEKHSQLIDAQIKSERLEHGAKRMVIFFRGAIGLVALAILLAFVWMAARARADRGLVIEALSVPPDLAQRGLTGEAVAAELADKLGVIDQVAQSFRSPETMKVNWGDDIKIVIPSTGVSIGELDTFLRRQLGGQTIIGGSIFRTPTGLRLTVRAGAHGAIDQTGSDATMDAMVQKAAEGVFEKTQPYRYSKYLEFTGRRDEAMAVARQLAATADSPSERAWAWAQISNLYERTDIRQSAAAAKRGIREDPNNALAYLNANIAENLLAHNGEAARLAARATGLGLRGLGGLSEIGVNTSRANAAADPATNGDYAEVLRRLNRLSGRQYPGTEWLIGSRRAASLLGMHDVTASRHVVSVPSDAYFASHVEDGGGINYPQYATAATLDDWVAAEGFARQQLAILAREPEGPELAKAARDRNVLPRLAIALAKQGRAAEAGAIAQALPLDCYICLAARMQVAGALGDIPKAVAWADRAERMAPGRPTIPTLLSQLNFRTRQYPEALAWAGRAIKAGPHYADALKARGDALRKMGRLDEAVEAYEQAEQQAPRWGRLQIDRAVADYRLGNAKGARDRLKRAGTLDLSAGDRVVLGRLRRLIKA